LLDSRSTTPRLLNIPRCCLRCRSFISGVH